MSYTYNHPRPAVTADVVVFSIINGGLSLVLIERGGNTFKGMWALPGGFLRENEDLEDGARRELSEETGVSKEQLDGFPFIPFGTYGTPGRDPRGHVITVAFLTLVPSDRVHLVASTDAEKARWYSIDDLPPLAFDHPTIIADAKKALAGLLSTDMSEHADAVFSFLPEEFTLAQAQQAFEIIKGEPLDKRNFRKWISSHWRLTDLDKKTNTKSKKASLYKLSGRATPNEN